MAGLNSKGQLGNMNGGSHKGFFRANVVIKSSFFQEVVSVPDNCAAKGMVPINTVDECDRAATEIGLNDKKTSKSSTHQTRPEGCYYYRFRSEHQLVLATNPKNKGNGAMRTVTTSRYPICKDLYKIVSVGNCASQGMSVIGSKEECEDAAKNIRLDAPVPTAIEISDANFRRPEGCHLHRDTTLVFASNPANKGNGAETSVGRDTRYPICKTISEGAPGLEHSLSHSVTRSL